MKTNRLFIIVIILFIVLAAGCSNGSRIKNKGNKIVVHQNRYEKATQREITKEKDVQKVKDILDKIDWDKREGTSHFGGENLAVFEFYFVDTNKKYETDKVIYQLWVNEGVDRAPIVVASAMGKFTQLSKKDTSELVKILKGDKTIYYD